MSRLTLNKGEWSEAYCIFAIIGNSCIKTCDDLLTEQSLILKIVGGQFSVNCIYKIRKNEISFEVKEQDIKYHSQFFLDISKDVLRNINSNKKTFSIQSVDKLITDLEINNLKSCSRTKEDTRFEIEDNLTNKIENLGFSIKSFLGSSPTLLNSSGATKFRYHLSQCDIPKELEKLRGKTLVCALISNKIFLDYVGMKNQVYKDNLQKIDLRMPEIIAESLKVYFSSKKKKVSEIAGILQSENPLRLDNPNLYSFKLSELLFHTALGLFPNKIWNGTQDVNGGCIIVKKDGTIMCFYTFRKEFIEFYKKYLFDNCYFDTPSLSRHGCGILKQDSKNYFIELPLQIRIVAPIS